MNSVLKETLEKLRSDRLELQGKIKEMKAAEDAIRTLLGEEDSEKPKQPSSRITVFEKIKAVLLEHPKGLEVNRLTNFVNLQFEENAPKSSIQSQLSRMSGETVVNVDGVWRLITAPMPPPPVRPEYVSNEEPNPDEQYEHEREYPF